MINEIETFLKSLRLNLSITTYTRKKYQIRAFYKYVVSINKDYFEVTKDDIENYLLSINGATQYRRQVYQIIQGFYDFLEYPNNPTKDIVFLPYKKKAFLKFPHKK